MILLYNDVLNAQSIVSNRGIQSEIFRGKNLSKGGERSEALSHLLHTLLLAYENGKVHLIADTELALIEHYERYMDRDSLDNNLERVMAYCKNNNLTAQLVQTLLFQAQNHLRKHQYQESLQFSEEALILAQSLKDNKLKGRCLLQKASGLRNSSDHTAYPLEYYKEALSVLEKAKDTCKIVRASLLITSAEIDSIERRKIFDKAEQLTNSYGSPRLKIDFLNFKASHVQPQRAIAMRREALSINKKLGIDYFNQHLLIQIAHSLTALKKYDRAIQTLDSAIVAFPGYLSDDGASIYYEIYREKGDYQKAVEFMEKSRQFVDARKITELKSLVAKWETKLNTKETEWELNDQKNRNLALLGFLILAGILGMIVFYAYYRQKRAKKLLAQQNDMITKQSEALKSLEQLKSRFFANVSHELRTPLTLMLGPITKLMHNHEYNPIEMKLLTFLNRNTLHLKNLVDEILDLSKLENNKMELKEEPVLIHEYVNNHVTQFFSIGGYDTAAFSAKIDLNNQLIVMLDTNKFGKIINNLISNAIKFTPIEGEIKFIANETNTDLHFQITDTGRGIDKNDLPYIFDRFYQSKNSNAPSEGGTGIGLSLCKELTELMNGEIWAESEVGLGSIFHLKIPKIIADSKVLKSTVEYSESKLHLENADKNNVNNLTEEIDAANHTILIVEDNKDLREYIQILLSDYNTILAENGEVAINYLQKNKSPSLIISDIMMPIMDGLQLLDRLKSSEALRHVPVIMLTAKTDRLIKMKALRYGIDDYLTKPFDEEELRVRILNLITHLQERKNNVQEGGSQNNSSSLSTKSDREWLIECENFILMNLSSNLLAVPMIASNFNISESTLTRLLKRLVGLSPGKYVQELKLNQAKHLIQNNSRLSIIAIADEVGFSDPAAFSRSFKKRFGRAPSSMKL